MTIHSIKSNFQYDASVIRHEMHDGTEHMVVPVVMIVEGVLNDALILSEEFGAFPDAWNGIPVPVLHPEEHGQSISANRPDIVDRNTIGRVYNTHVDGKKLKAELWINKKKAEKLGHGDVVKALEAGFVMEVSTGYFAEDEAKEGEYNGRPYNHIHRGIRPDHLALLPTQIGACSVKDGCGTRVNNKRSSMAMKVNDALAVLQKALGLKSNCECKGDDMSILDRAKALVKANKLDAKQLAAIQEMDPKDRDLMAAFISALGATGAEDVVEEAEEELEDELPEGMADEEEKPVANAKKKAPVAAKPVTMTAAEINKLVANGVKDHLRRSEVTSKLVANERNTLTEKQMADMPVDQLEAVEKMIRPADYSGAGAFATNSSSQETTVTPMRPRGVLVRNEKKEG